MKIRNVRWSIGKLISLRNSIEEQPLYQRGEVWTLENRQLLIDSILRGYDIPKLYLRALPNNSLYDFQVVDGQQRLTSIWSFTIDGKFSLPSHDIEERPWKGCNFDQLSASQKRRLRNFGVVIALIENATDDAVRDLFARLQRGSTLNPPEIRNSIRSLIGVEIRAVALNHPFFTESRSNRPLCSFSAKRYKHHDLVAHGFALEINRLSRDLKAANLRQLYQDYAETVPSKLTETVNKNLTYLLEMQRSQPGLINRKWGFVDLYLVVSTMRAKLPKPEALAERFLEFEQERLKYVRRPSQLLSGKRKDKNLFDYINAFNLSGGVAGNLVIRNTVLTKKLLP